MSFFSRKKNIDNERYFYTIASFNALNVHTVASNTEHISSVLSHTDVKFSTKCAKLEDSPEIKA